MPPLFFSRGVSLHPPLRDSSLVTLKVTLRYEQRLSSLKEVYISFCYSFINICLLQQVLQHFLPLQYRHQKVAKGRDFLQLLYNDLCWVHCKKIKNKIYNLLSYFC